jgi:hypothetical protein
VRSGVSDHNGSNDTGLTFCVLDRDHSARPASGSISDITLNEAHATNDDERRRLFAGFHAHMHAAPLLRLVGINVGHPFQDDWDP